MKDIFGTLEEEHDKHRELLDRVARTQGDSPSRRKYFPMLVEELRSHANAEERTLYATMMKDADAQPKASHSVHEHEVMDDLMAELQETDYSNPHWIATFRKLAEKTRHHMDEEEEETFEAGRKLIDDSTAKELARRFEEEKARELEGQPLSS
ncbi:hypothetical protein Poly30_46470 [Planctomycetes bacterium Poly30]|uniref:Hemerythrin-like domain-containing protein n=1 Tax=Saltatorellus ferox TaxID=2528018 RepID=A0A518EYC3_9BACT|nr:hypothetical protein Poly30_46470 [Planctomycetes bacterium Poly30]